MGIFSKYLNCVIIAVIGTGYNSCASILNDSTTDIEIAVARPTTFTIRDSSIIIRERAFIIVNRSAEDLVAIAKQDSVEKQVIIRSKNSQQFYSNIIFNYGLGLLFDWRNKKRFVYPEFIYLDLHLPGRGYSYFKPNLEGQVNFSVSIPYVNSFYLHPIDTDRKSNFGFLGMSSGLEYSYNSHKFVEVNLYGATNFFLPFLAVADIDGGEVENAATLFASLTDNYVLNDNYFGYGLSYTRDYWNYSDLGSGDPDYIPKNSINSKTEAIGMVCQAYRRFGKHFYAGVIYRPTILRVQPELNFEYEHFLSLDLRWKYKIIAL